MSSSSNNNNIQATDPMDLPATSFTIESFLLSAKLPEKEKDTLAKKYAALLTSAEVGITEENQLSLLTTDFLKQLKIPLGHAAAIADAASTWGKKGLSQIIQKVYQQRPQWKCILEKPEKPPVDLDLPWTGRKQEIQQLEDNARQNIQQHLLQRQTKQCYRCDLVHGGLGVGKSRLVVEANYHIAKALQATNPSFFKLEKENEQPVSVGFNDIFGGVAHVFIDLSRSDQYGSRDQGLDVSTSLGLRVAAHFFFGVGFDELMGVRLTWEETRSFTFENVCELISKQYASAKHLLLTIQIDEFAEVDNSVVNEMLVLLGTYVTSKHHLRLCILVQLTGTDTESGRNAISNSRLIPIALLLEPLASGEETQISEIELKKWNKDFLLNLPLFLQAVDSMGRVPRYLQFFLTEVATKTLQADVAEFLRDVLKSVAIQIFKAYDIKKWNKLLGGTRVGVRRMLLWALSGHQVALEDQLNGITVEEARATGILMLEEVKGITEEKYTINVPLILLRAINITLQDIPDECLDSVKVVDDREFEKIMSALRILRQNMLVGIGCNSATYRELYPHAIGYDEDLDQLVPLQRLSEVYADGASSTHDSMHLWPMTATPILNGKAKTVDISKGGFLVHNVPKAPSNDALIVHPPSNVEGIQYKSFDNITRGNAPDPASKAVLKLGAKKAKSKKTIWAEFNKVNDSAHKEFYSELPSGAKFNLFVVSNKPLGKYQEIREATEQGNDAKGLPRGVSIVCHQNFQSYAGCFAHRGLYIPIKRKREEEEDEEDEEDE